MDGNLKSRLPIRKTCPITSTKIIDLYLASYSEGVFYANVRLRRHISNWLAIARLAKIDNLDEINGYNFRNWQHWVPGGQSSIVWTGQYIHRMFGGTTFDFVGYTNTYIFLASDSEPSHYVQMDTEVSF